MNNNIVGINKDKATQLIEKLNILLANYAIYYQNLRGFHWNISGNSFFELHEKFEELYTSANDSIDEIAERILTLGGRPLHSYTSFINTSAITEEKDVSSANDTVSKTLSNLSALIEKQRDILGLASESGDEGTADLMSGYLKEQEKTVWMLSAYLN